MFVKNDEIGAKLNIPCIDRATIMIYLFQTRLHHFIVIFMLRRKLNFNDKQQCYLVNLSFRSSFHVLKCI